MDHLDKLVASGVIVVERDPVTGETKIKLTRAAWESMVTAHSPPPPKLNAAHNRKRR